MEKSVQELCFLIQEVLFEKEKHFTISDPERLYKIAKENGLSGTVFEVALKHGLSSNYSLRFKKDFFKFVAQDEEQMNQIEQLKSMFDTYDITYQFLKGSELKSIYPKSYMRAMGDIDVLVSDKNRKKLEEIFEEKGISLQSRGYVHDYYETPSKISIEVHSRLTREEGLYPDLENIEDLLQHQNQYEMNILYLMYHLKKHLVSSGIGLRSVIDLALYSDRYKNMLDVEKLYQVLKTNNLDQLYTNIMMFNERYLNLDLSDLYISEEPLNDSLFELFTKYIIVSGIHGLGVSFNSFSGTLAATNKGRFKKLHSLMKIVFLPYNELQYMYPTLLKHKLFLPLAWVIRMFDLVFRSRKRRMYRLKQLFSGDTEVEETSFIFQSLGL